MYRIPTYSIKYNLNRKCIHLLRSESNNVIYTGRQTRRDVQHYYILCNITKYILHWNNTRISTYIMQIGRRKIVNK